MTDKQAYEIQKAEIAKIETVQEEIVIKGNDDTFCKYVSRELEGPISTIRKALENE